MKLSRILRYAAPACILAAYFYLTRDIWPPILAAFLLAVILRPLIQRLEARGWARSWAVAAVYAASLIVLALVLTWLVPAAIKQARSLADALQGWMASLTAPHATLHSTLRLGSKTFVIPSFFADKIPEFSSKATGWITTWLSWIANSLLAMAPNLIWLVLIPILAFYFLLDYEQIMIRGLGLIPASVRPQVFTLGSDIGVVFSRYIRSLGLLCLLDAFLTCAILTMMGVKQSVVLGLVAGVLYVVPYIGAITSTLLIAMTALVTGSVSLALWVVLAMVLLHQVFLDEILAPRLLGGHVGLHPILSVVAMLSGDRLFGPIGMVMAVPVAASIQIVVLHLFPHLASDAPGRVHPVLEALVRNEPQPTFVPADPAAPMS